MFFLSAKGHAVYHAYIYEAETKIFADACCEAATQFWAHAMESMGSCVGYQKTLLLFTGSLGIRGFPHAFPMLALVCKSGVVGACDGELAPGTVA